ncbi:MAG: methyltransferase family protein [Pannonibacter sp.]
MQEPQSNGMFRPIVPPPVQALGWAAVMWLAAWLWPEPAVRFPGQTVLAGLLAASGFAIDLVSVARFFRQRTTINPLKPEAASHLVVSGLYRYTRNPMYLGMLLVLVGWAVWLGHPLALFGPLLFKIVLTWLQILPEEAALEASFGQEYHDYKARVRRWL